MTFVQSQEAGPGRVHPLDNPAWSSLAGPHAHVAEGGALARRYPVDMSPFAAVREVADPQVWPALAQLAGPREVVIIPGPASLPEHLPPGWEVEMALPGVQLAVTPALVTAPDPEAVTLGADDVEEMLDLVARTEPGPFLPRTRELGTYLGLREGGKLIAMAGERMHPPGWTEISAVCTDPGFRGRGLAGRLVRAVAHGITERGEQPLLHAAATNTGAIRLYETLGFGIRWRPVFFALRTPAR